MAYIGLFVAFREITEKVDRAMGVRPHPHDEPGGNENWKNCAECQAREKQFWAAFVKEWAASGYEKEFGPMEEAWSWV